MTGTSMLILVMDWLIGGLKTKAWNSLLVIVRQQKKPEQKSGIRPT